jgi:hypothetical protein
MEHTSGAKMLLERRVLRVVNILRLLLGIEVVEVTEELIKPVQRRQEFILIAEMVLPELTQARGGGEMPGRKAATGLSTLVPGGSARLRSFSWVSSDNRGTSSPISTHASAVPTAGPPVAVMIPILFRGQGLEVKCVKGVQHIFQTIDSEVITGRL